MGQGGGAGWGRGGEGGFGTLDGEKGGKKARNKDGG